MRDALKRLPVAALERIDSICQRFESQAKAGLRPGIADYINEVEGDERSALLTELVLLEMEYRRRGGESPDPTHYVCAFPEIDETIFERVNCDHPTPPVAAIGPMTEPIPQMPAPDLPPGTVVGSYQIEKVLGRGGMGTVYSAKHQHLKRRVALKLQERTAATSDRKIRRFRNEAELIARLSHPNVVTAYDAGEFGDRPFLVTELIEGSDLARDVRDNGPFSFDDALKCIRDAAEGLACAHENGIVHRDVKPSNLLRDDSGSIQVADLGLARLREFGPRNAAEISSETSPGMAMGTIDYMAPEQARDSSTADARSDVYSLGCTLYFLLTGQPVFEGDTPLDRVVAHASMEPPDLQALCPDAGSFGDALLKRMLAKNPEDRFQSMNELIAAIDRAAPVQSGHKPARSRRHLVPIAIGLSVAIVTLVAGGVIWHNGNQEDRPPLPSPDDTAAMLDAPGEILEAETRTVTALAPAVIPFDNPQEIQRQWAEHLGIPESSAEQTHRFVLIPPGQFLMGSTDEQIEYLRGIRAGVNPPNKREGPQEAVTIDHPFYLSTTEVTFGQFAKFVSATDYSTTIEMDREFPPRRAACTGYRLVGGVWRRDPDADWQHYGEFEPTDSHPVMNVSHLDATAYCAWLSDMDPEHSYRLPFQGEWEFAARAGTDTIYFHADDLQERNQYAWHRGNSGNAPHPVATLSPNPFGLFDIYGNVDEWCRDRFLEESDGNEAWQDWNRPIHPSYNEVVARGGIFIDSLETRSAARRYTARQTAGLRGFRVLREVATGATSSVEASD